MRTVTEIYEEYRIPHIIRQHQLRVAAVSVVLARAAGADETPSALTGLFHDMGNILKMDLRPDAVLLPLIAPDTLEGLQVVRDEFQAKYGADEHMVALAIAREIALPDAVIEMIDNMRFSRTEAVLREGPIEMQIVKYADLRVAPTGIVTLNERLREARERYRVKKFDSGDADWPPVKLVEAEELCGELELLVCTAAKLDPAAISDASVAGIIEELKNRQIS